MIKTKFISLHDYLYSFKRGVLSQNCYILISTCFKKTLFLIFKILINLKCIKKKKLISEDVISILVYFPKASGMGDMIMAGHFFKLLRSRYDKAQIDLCSSSISFTNQSYFNTHIKHEDGVLKEIAVLKRKKYDLILYPEKSLFGTIVLFFLKFRYFIGYIDGYKIYHNLLEKNFADFNVIDDHYYFKSLNLLKDELLEYNPTEHLSIPLNAQLEFPRDLQDFVVVVPSVNWENRTVDFEILQKHIDYLLSLNHKIVLLGSNESKDRIDQLLKNNIGSQLISTPGNISIEELKNYIAKCEFVICGDCGPMHIAYALDKPVYTFWGPTFPHLRIPPNGLSAEDFIFYKEKCGVSNCYNMEHKPFCKTCLRLSAFHDMNHFKVFLEKIYG